MLLFVQCLWGRAHGWIAVGPLCCWYRCPGSPWASLFLSISGANVCVCSSGSLFPVFVVVVFSFSQHLGASTRCQLCLARELICWFLTPVGQLRTPIPWPWRRRQEQWWRPGELGWIGKDLCHVRWSLARAHLPPRTWKPWRLLHSPQLEEGVLFASDRKRPVMLITSCSYQGSYHPSGQRVIQPECSYC